MKTQSALTKRAAAIRPDYARIAAPSNPRADEAREAKRAYMLQLQVNTAHAVEAQAVGVEPPAPDPCSEETEQDKIAAALAHWPDMQPYAATARVETWMTTLPGDVVARGKVVTVTVFEKEGERE